MPRRIIAFVILAVVLAAVFVGLGFWQLSRLAERQASNAVIGARLSQPEVSFASLNGDSVVHVHRRVAIQGVPDTVNEFVLTGRSRNGSPGVYIITPMRAADDTAVLVIRGWVYAPDAATVDLARWREGRTEFHGYTLALPYAGYHATPGKRAIRTLESNTVDELLPYPFRNMYIVAQDSGHVDSIPARLLMPVLNNGPHLNYAIQWFFFAAIAIVGAGIVARKSVTGPQSPVPGP